MEGVEEGMNYELRLFDTALLKFSVAENSNVPEIDIICIDESNKHLLPLDLELSGDGLSRWLRHRTIPKNRAYMHNFLSKCGLNINRPMNIIRVSKGLSLTDCYWVVEEGFEGSFDNYNLYDNRFSKILAMIAFTGFGSSIRTSLASCPEFTTNGMLPKCWRRIDGTIKLYPRCMPFIFIPNDAAVLTTERTAAFIPGASPPLVSTPVVFT